jgi:hypothetical protein
MVARRILLLVTMTAGLGMTGCSGGPYTYWQEGVTHPASNAPSMVASKGVSLTVIREIPFADDRDGNGIFAAIQSSYQGRAYKFARGKPPSDWNGYTLVLTFADGVIGNSNQCRSNAPPLLGAPAERTAIIADYCLGQTLVAEVIGRIDGVTGPQDPKLTALVHAVMSEMFMQRAPRDHRDNDF